jgi:hypothetical protein
MVEVGFFFPFSKGKKTKSLLALDAHLLSLVLLPSIDLLRLAECRSLSDPSRFLSRTERGKVRSGEEG